MEINEALGAPQASAQGTLTGGVSIVETFDNFLTLLTTQLQNQDPLSPLETNEFTQQLVQFTEVEQSLQTNDKLDQLISLQSNTQLSATLDYLGKEVAVNSDTLTLQQGQAKISYNLNSNAETATLFIYDKFGNLIRNDPVDTSFGHHEVVWDGLDQNGTSLPDGNYSFLVSAVDANNAQVELTQAAHGLVTAVRMDNGSAVLELGDVEVSADDVVAVGLRQSL